MPFIPGLGSSILPWNGRVNNAGSDFQVPNGYTAGDSFLVDHLGRPLSRVNKSPMGASGTLGIPVGGYSDDAWFSALRVDRMGNTRQALENIIFRDNIEGATQNSQIWTNTVTTQTITQSALGLLFNASAITTATTGSMVVSQQQFNKLAFGPLHFRARANVINFTNSTQDFGFGLPSSATTIAAINNGAYFRVKADQSVVGVVAVNGAEAEVTLTLNGPATNSAGASGNLLVNNQFYNFDIILDDDDVAFQIADPSLGKIIAYGSYLYPAARPRGLAVTHIPCFFRTLNGTTPGTAPQLVVGECVVSCKDWAMNMPQAYSQPLLGYGAHLNPTTFAQNGTYANSAAPSNATLSNTAAGYTTLGGLYSFAAVAGAATDYALFGFTVPSPYTFMCTGCYATCWNTGAAVATTPSLLVWALGHNATTINLSTGARIVTTFGTHQLPVGAAIGANAADIHVSFETPIPTFPGKLFIVILRMPAGTATASQVIQGSVQPRGFFI